MCLGIPGQIVEIIDSEHCLAKVDIGGIRRPVNIACVIEPEQTAEDCLHDWVLVHVGFAMSRIDEDEAEKTLALLQELDELHNEIS